MPFSGHLNIIVENRLQKLMIDKEEWDSDDNLNAKDWTSCWRGSRDKTSQIYLSVLSHSYLALI